MGPSKWASNALHAPSAIPGELITDYRARVALQQHDAAELRRKELAEQVSELNTPEERIRIWERLHALPLPREAVHPLLRIVARGTGLSLSQLQDEQRRRLSAPKTVPAAVSTAASAAI